MTDHRMVRRVRHAAVSRLLRRAPGVDRAWRALRHRAAVETALDLGERSPAEGAASGSQIAGELAVTPFVILCQARTGSNLVQSELCRRWPAVRCLGEEYGPKLLDEGSGESTREITARVFAATDQQPIVGCRVFYEHLTAGDFREVLTVPGIKVVHLQRRNILRRYVSLQIAVRSQIWARGRRHDAPTIEDRAVTIDVDDFIATTTLAAERRAQLQWLIADAGVEVLDVWYEDLSEQLDTQLRRIAAFLGLGAPASEPPTFLVRQNPEPLRLLVRNYDNVRHRLAPTPMREFLDPGDAGGRGWRGKVRSERRTGWPTRQQELLLSAALLPPRAAVEAFAQWRDTTNPDTVDDGSRRLYPLVHRNLRRAGVETTFDAVLRDAYVNASGRNQMLLHTLERVLGLMDDAEVPALVLKGAALTVLHYRDRGVRPMSDLDVMVPSKLLDRGLDVLRADGWNHAPSDTNRSVQDLPLRHARTLERGDAQVDLHRHALAGCTGTDLDTELWDASVELRVGSARARALAPADQLLHAFAHGMRYNALPPLRWIADAHVVITSSGQDLDWDRLLRLATRHRLGAYTSNALTYLDGLFPSIVPPSVVAAAGALPVSRYERREFELMMRQSHWLPRRWYRYRRSEPDRDALSAAFGFIGDLRVVYDLDHASEVPRRAVAGMYRRWRPNQNGVRRGRDD